MRNYIARFNIEGSSPTKREYFEFLATDDPEAIKVSEKYLSGLSEREGTRVSLDKLMGREYVKLPGDDIPV